MHEEYRRTVSGADKAVLFIHGILGTPDHFGDFIPLVPQDMSVHSILLDGHGKGVRDFSKTSMQKWEAQVSLAIRELERDHGEIYIMAHSLGCLLAIGQAVHDPKIQKLFLLAVPLKLSLKPKLFVNSLNVYFGKGAPEDEELAAARKCYGITDSKNILLYLGWIPRFLELFSKMAEIRKLIGSVAVPCIACQSMKDEMVSKKCADILRNDPGIKVLELENSGHYYYEKDDLSLIKDEFAKFLT